MADRFSNCADDLQGPATKAVAVTPNDSTDLSFTSKRLHIGTGGTISLVTSGGDTVSYTAASGAYLFVRAVRVRSTGTTASNIVAEF